MAALEFRNISKRFGDQVVLDRVSLSVETNEFFSLLGPSGCGKTTLLRIAAGFEQPDSGRVFLDGEDITDLPPNRRPINTVFQSYALFPHLNVYDNIAFGLRVEGKRNVDGAVSEMLKLIQLESMASKKPSELSGGQKQRVAIARALIKKPRVLLLDEPLAALDLKLRQKMLFEIDLIHDEVGISFVYVTHDQGEAMAVSDRIALLNEGRVEQVGGPIDLYEAPESSFAAAFIGDTNFLDGTVSRCVDKEYVDVAVEGLGPVRCWNDKGMKEGDAVHLSIRPEKMHICREQPEDQRKRTILKGVVADVIYQGDHTKYWVVIDGHTIAVSQQHHRYLLDEEPIRWEQEVWIWWHADDGYMLEQYRKRDENLTDLPPDAIGEAES